MLNLRSILHSRIRANKMFFAYSRLIKHSTFLMFVLTTHGKSLIHSHNNSKYQKEICHAVTMPKAMETYHKSLPCIKYRIFFLFGILSIWYNGLQNTCWQFFRFQIISCIYERTHLSLFIHIW